VVCNVLIMYVCMYVCYHRASNHTSHPLLAAFLREESRLAKVKYIADVLEWHRILFEVYV